MKLANYKEKLATLGLATFLSGCTAVSANKFIGILGPALGAAAVGLETNKEETHQATTPKNSFFEMGPVYRPTVVKEVRNVPLEIRNEIHPLYFSRTLIEDDSAKLGPRTGAFLRYGRNIPIIEDSFFLNAGIEGELSGLINADNPGNPLTSYSVFTKAGPTWNNLLIPKLFVGAEAKLSEKFSFNARYSVWREDLAAESLYEGDAETGRNHTYKLVDMLVGAPSVGVKYYKTPGSYVFLELGMQTTLDKNYHTLGRKADIEFEENPFTIMIGSKMNF